MKEEHDALVEVTLLKTEQGGRESPIFCGYRGCHLIKEDYLTSSSMKFINDEMISPSDTRLALVQYITPEVYPASLWVGKKMNLQEGSKVIGYTVVKEVYNNTLIKGT